MDSIIYMYAFNCIYYSLEFLLTALLFIHTVSVSCLYTYHILECMYYYTTINMFAFIARKY